MKYHIVFIGVFIFLSNAFGQTQSATSVEDNAAGNQDLPEQIDSEQTATEDIQESAEDSSNRQNAEFDVFRPTEDISEDLAVPFPVDI